MEVTRQAKLSLGAALIAKLTTLPGTIPTYAMHAATLNANASRRRAIARTRRHKAALPASANPAQPTGFFGQRHHTERIHHSIRETSMTKMRWGFRGKTQLPLFMVWREFWERGEVVHADVLFNSRDWIGW